jgi:DsbC/DsbD-like thiol-disulfide interchange protein
MTIIGLAQFPSIISLVIIGSLLVDAALAIPGFFDFLTLDIELVVRVPPKVKWKTYWRKP